MRLVKVCRQTRVLRYCPGTARHYGATMKLERFPFTHAKYIPPTPPLSLLKLRLLITYRHTFRYSFRTERDQGTPSWQDRPQAEGRQKHRRRHTTGTGEPTNDSQQKGSRNTKDLDPKREDGRHHSSQEHRTRVAHRPPRTTTTTHGWNHIARRVGPRTRKNRPKPQTSRGPVTS